MSAESDKVKRYRQYTEEFRTIAADKRARENRQALLRLAVEYDGMAKRLEAMDLTMPARARPFTFWTRVLNRAK